MSLRKNQNGLILMLLIVGAVVTFSYIAIKNFMESDSAKRIEDTASSVVETVEGTTEAVESGREVIERITP